MSTTFEPEVIRRVISRSIEETESLGEKLGARLRKGCILGLIGDLGAGKTCFTRGLSRGLKVGHETVVNSPTFVIMQKYNGDIPVYHSDVYRMESDEEYMDLDMYEIAQDGVLIIEWADKFIDLLPEKTILCSITHSKECVRELSFSCKSSEYAKILKNL